MTDNQILKILSAIEEVLDDHCPHIDVDFVLSVAKVELKAFQKREDLTIYGPKKKLTKST